MTTTTATPDRVDAYEAKIDSDEAFKTAVRVAAANRYIGCQGMLTARQYGQIVQELGRFAMGGDWQAYVVAGLGLPNRFGNGRDTADHFARQMLKIVTAGWDDVLARTGPEPCRYSAAQHRFSVAQKVEMLALLRRLTWTAERDCAWGYGWALEAVAAKHRVRLPAPSID